MEAPIVLLVLGFFFFAFLCGVAATLYQKCGPNRAMIISGAMVKRTGRHNFQVVQGGGSVVLPLIQRRDFLSMELMTIDVKTTAPIITKSAIPVFVEGVAQIKVASDADSIATAAEQFLGQSEEDIKNIAHETLTGHLRAIVGSMEVEPLIQDREQFAQQVQEVSISDLLKMGLTIVSFTIKDVRDPIGYIDNLGKERSSRTKKTADVAVALNQKEAAIAQTKEATEAKVYQEQKALEAAQARIDRESKESDLNRVLEMQKAENAAKIQQMKYTADLDAQSEAARRTQILVAEQQKIKIVEAQRVVELQSVEVQKRQVMLEAEVTKPAEAEQMKTRIYAQAEQEKRKLLAQADAEAAKMRAQGEADAIRLRAQAEAEAIRATGLAHAEAEKAKGLAEAAVIEAKGVAEAEAMAKKAEAFKQYNDAALSSMLIEKLPDVVNAAAAPLSKIGSMTVLSTGGEYTGAGKITNEVLNVAAQSLTLIKGLTGVDLAQTLRKDNGHTHAAPSGNTADKKEVT